MDYNNSYPINLSTYTQVNYLPQPAPLLSVGSKIQDMDDTAITEAQKAHKIAIQKAQEIFQAETQKYNTDLEQATLKAKEAQAQLPEAKKKQILAASLLAISIIAAVGITVAAISTGLFPLAFAAIPFVIGIIPASIFTHIFNKKISQLKKAIQAPNKLKKPLLDTPAYERKKDLDLKSSRMKAIHRIGTKTLAKIANKLSKKDIINYALLDGVTILDRNKRPLFYAKCIQLINEYKNIVKAHKRNLEKLQEKRENEIDQLKSWKDQKDREITRKEIQMISQSQVQHPHHHQQNPHHRHGNHHGAHGHTITYGDIRHLKEEAEKKYEHRRRVINNRNEHLNNTCQVYYTQAKHNIEMQFAQWKQFASAQ